MTEKLTITEERLKLLLKDAIREYFQEVGDIELELSYDPTTANKYGGVILPFVEKIRSQLLSQGYTSIAANLAKYWIWDGIDGLSMAAYEQLGYNYAQANALHGFLGRYDVEMVQYKDYIGPTNGRLFPVRFTRVPDTVAVLTRGVTLEAILKRVVEIVQEDIEDLGNDPGGIDFSPVGPKGDR